MIIGITLKPGTKQSLANKNFRILILIVLLKHALFIFMLY